MDAITGFFAQLLAGTGFEVGRESTLLAVLVVAVLIVVVVLGLSRRSGRLEVQLDDPRDFPAGMPAVEPVFAPARAPVSEVQPDSDRSNRTLEGAGHVESAATGTPSRLAADAASSRETSATSVARSKAGAMAAGRSPQNDQVRFELMQATLSSLQREQLALRKLLENCNAGLRSIEQLAAAFPSLRTEHASIRKQLAELTARFDTASEVLADLLQTEDRPSDR